MQLDARLGRIGIGDGLAIGRSGRLYAPLSQPFANVVQVLSPGGALVGELPSRAARAALAIPVDTPASVAFRGTELLVSNHALTTMDPDHFAILAIEVGETGLALHFPHVGAIRSG